MNESWTLAEDDPPSDETSERRFNGPGDYVGSRTEAGVDVAGIGALVSADSDGDGGSVEPATGCRWAVVFAPGASAGANLAALEQASASRGMESGDPADQGWMEASIEALAHEMPSVDPAEEGDLAT